jgi:hypothetical protein
MKMNFKELSNSELIESYPFLLEELRARKIIRSKNVIGDLGEYLAIDFYNKTAGLPNLQVAPAGTQNVDALSRKGERYSIKATTGNVTGVFYGFPENPTEMPDKKFEYVIVVKFSKNYELEQINELTWDDFLKYKRWHSRMRAWNLPVTKEVLLNTKKVYKP